MSTLVVFIGDTTAKHSTAFWLGFCVNKQKLMTVIFTSTNQLGS